MYTYNHFVIVTKELYEDMLGIEMPTDGEMMASYRELKQRKIKNPSKVPVWASQIDQVMTCYG